VSHSPTFIAKCRLLYAILRKGLELEGWKEGMKVVVQSLMSVTCSVAYHCASANYGVIWLKEHFSGNWPTVQFAVSLGQVVWTASSKSVVLPVSLAYVTISSCKHHFHIWSTACVINLDLPVVEVWLFDCFPTRKTTTAQKLVVARITDKSDFVWFSFLLLISTCRVFG
jgi:hypothetical protein